MANITIEFLVPKPNKNGPPNWYWQPSAALKRAGWEGKPLGNNEAAAIDAARAINRTVEEWRKGGEVSSIKTRHREGTLAAAIERYRDDVVNGRKPDGSRRIAESTAENYENGLKRLEVWGGKHSLSYINRTRVRKLRDNMVRSNVGQHAIHNTLKVGRQVFEHLIDCDKWEQGKNPFSKFGFSQPPPRQVIWSPPARELIVQTADALGHPSIALAIMLGYAIGQREADILETTIPQFVHLPQHKMQPEDYAVLAAEASDGVPRGIRIRQNKTAAWIEVPVVGDVRMRIEQNIARAKDGGRFEIILDDKRCITNRRVETGTHGRIAAYTGKTGAKRFQHDFADVREAAAIAAEKTGNADLASEIRTLQFRDLRRTCVVYLGELGLEDHLIAAITGHDIDETRRILKTYMPRTTGRAARAVALTTAREAKEKERSA